MQHPCQKDGWGAEKLYSKETEARPGYPLCIFVLYNTTSVDRGLSQTLIPSGPFLCGGDPLSDQSVLCPIQFASSSHLNLKSWPPMRITEGNRINKIKQRDPRRQTPDAIL